MRHLLIAMLLVALALSLVEAQEPPAAGAAPVAGAAGAPGKLLEFKNGYIKNCPEAQALWVKLGEATALSHQKLWEVFVAQQAQPLDKKALKQAQQAYREAGKAIRDLREQLKAYWVPLNEGGVTPGTPGAAPPTVPATPAGG